jgi:type II secretory pathway component PulF
MQYTYKATNAEGKIIQGLIDANDTSTAATYLRSRQMYPISIVPKKAGGFLSLSFSGKVTTTDVVFFTRQLSSMLASGLTLMQALNILKTQVQKEKLFVMMDGIIRDIEDGKTFSQAIEKYPDIFSPIYISLIKTAESSGLLDKVLLRLADNLEKEQKLRGTIKSAMMYPAIVVTGMIIIVIIMMIFVIPQLSTLYENLGVPLPLPTLIIVGLSNFVTTFWPVVIGVIVLLVFAFKRWKKSEAGALIIDTMSLKLPIFGKLNNQMILTEFTRTLGLLVGSGTLVVDAFAQASGVTGNILYKNAIAGIARRIEKGVTIGDAMTAYPLFPQIIIQMVKIGEETGKLDESLLKVSEYFEREVDQTVKTLTTAMEPIIMIILGIGVAFLIISIITPIYSLTSAIQ